MPSTTVFSTPSKDRHRLAFRTPFSALQVTDLNSQKPRQRAACPRQRLARTPTEASGEPDIWSGSAADLAAKEAVVVYPVAGWWKNRPKLDQSDKGVNYSLVVSIEAPEVEVDLWTPVYQQVAAVIEV
ncbi:hypothetical protein [Micrococcus luteus]|uniref:hypothetical protein n=1 Tax=Micrococcus luteus TaxID=1270 RepID=UPI0013966AE3|nr:hypothetical protein [Micrococcus luteus]